MEEKFGYIYLTTNLINGKIYVGQHSLKSKTQNYKGSGKEILRALKKYGKENFKMEVIEWCESFEELNEREKFWIEHYNSRERSIGYNITEGGQGISGFVHSEESKKKISEHNGRYWKGKLLHPNTRKAQLEYITTHPSPRRGTHCSEATKEKLRQCNLGKPSPMKGRKHSEETRQKLRNSHKGRPREDKRGISPSEETKEKISISMMKFSEKAFCGKERFSEETKEKIRQSAKGRIYINNGIITKCLKPSESEHFLLEWWKKGKCKREKTPEDRIRINNGIITKNIKIKFLDYYLNNGWKKGRVK